MSTSRGMTVCGEQRNIELKFKYRNLMGEVVERAMKSSKNQGYYYICIYAVMKLPVPVAIGTRGFQLGIKK